MNQSTLMRLRIDYVENKIDATAEEYRDVISQLILEVERLMARDISSGIIINNLREKK